MRPWRLSWGRPPVSCLLWSRALKTLITAAFWRPIRDPKPMLILGTNGTLKEWDIVLTQ